MTGFLANASGTSAVVQGLLDVAIPVLESATLGAIAPELAVLVTTATVGELAYYAWTQLQTDQLQQAMRNAICSVNPSDSFCSTVVQWYYHISYSDGAIDNGVLFSPDNHGYPIGSQIDPGEIHLCYIYQAGYFNSYAPTLTEPDGTQVQLQALRRFGDNAFKTISGVTFTHDSPDSAAIKNAPAETRKAAARGVSPEVYQQILQSMPQAGTLKAGDTLPKNSILVGDPTSTNPVDQTAKLIPASIMTLPPQGIQLKDLPDNTTTTPTSTPTTPTTTTPTTTTPDNTASTPTAIIPTVPDTGTGTGSSTGAGTGTGTTPTTATPSATGITSTTYNPDGSISIRSTSNAGNGVTRATTTTFNPDGTITQTQDPPLTSSSASTGTGALPTSTTATDPTAPATQGDIQKILDKLAPLAGGIAIGGTVLLPQLSRIEAKIPDVAQVRSAAKAGSCEASQPGGCPNGLGDQLKGLGDNLGQKLDALTQAGQGAALVSIKAGVDLLNTKVGDLPLVGGMMGWMDSFERWSQSSRVLEVIAAVSAVHNGIMLSQNFTFILEQAITDIINIPHLILDPHGEAFDFHKALGKTIDAWGISIFGKETWALDKKEFQALNRIYQSATNAMYGIQQLFYDQMQMTEQIRTVLGKLGNAHLNNGNLHPDDFNPQPDPAPIHGKFLSNLSNFNDKLQDATNFIMEVDMIAQSIIQAEQIAQQLTHDVHEINENINKIEENEKKKREKDMNEAHLPAIGLDAIK